MSETDIDPRKDFTGDVVVVAAGAIGPGGAHHRYEVTGFDPSTNPAAHGWFPDPAGKSVTLMFQHGPIGEAGRNGITELSLLRVVLDRLHSFQAGPYACRENAHAAKLVELAIGALQERTANRQARGVEGTNTP
jgi:hypothetical protein